MRDERVSGGGLLEAPTLTCSHCNCVVILNPQRRRERGYCARCDHYICDKAGCRANCNPISQMLELAQKYPDQSWLVRGLDGETFFDPRIKEKERIF
jgi:uncharacterized paraquat-inducible protein A